MLPRALQFLIVMIASSSNEQMQKRLDYKTEEVLVLKKILKAVTGKGRIDFKCLRHFVFFGQRHLRYVISEYMAHYHHERFLQGIGGSLIQQPAANDNHTDGEVRCRSRLDGLSGFYYREAA